MTTKVTKDLLEVGGTLLVVDEKPQNTSGGTPSAGAWNSRDLNTVRKNTISGASLASNQITLPAGSYSVEAFAPAFDVNAHMLRLYNVTDSAVIATGLSNNAPSGTNGVNNAILKDEFTLGGTKTLRLDHYTQTAKSTVGLGVECNISGTPERYAVVEIKEV